MKFQEKKFPFLQYCAFLKIMVLMKSGRGSKAENFLGIGQSIRLKLKFFLLKKEKMIHSFQAKLIPLIKINDDSLNCLWSVLKKMGRNHIVNDKI